ncbi:hypothetical protein ACHAQA_002957 [Verticillium albo-atrum]
MGSSVFHVQEHTIEASHVREYARATANAQDEKLLLHVKQYVPKDNTEPHKGDVTLIGGHANGFPKELYEPLWEDLYHEAKSRNIRIRSIIIADAAWQGKSGLLNEEALGNDPSWLDHARDILNVINVLRPPPPLIGLGHSFGGSILANVALMHPRLLTSLVLVDPVISRFASTPGPGGPATASVRRRETWKSREDAEQAFKRSPFYKKWDPRVLDQWVKHGVRDVPGQDTVALTTNKHQEIFTYIRPSWEAYDPKGQNITQPHLVPDLDPSLNNNWPTYPVYRPEGPQTHASLPKLRPSVLYLFGGKSDISTPELQAEKMDLTGTGVGGSGGSKAGRVKSIIHEDSGHLVALEAPKFCAAAATEWIKSERDRWWAAECEYEIWTRKPKVERQTVSDEFKKYIGKL